MKQRTNKQINSDFKFDKELEKLVTKECRRVLVVSLRGDTVVISGEKSSLDLVNSREDLTIKDLINHMKELGESSSTDDFVYDSTAELHFPPLERKFDGPHWDHATAKSTVTQWFTLALEGMAIRSIRKKVMSLSFGLIVNLGQHLSILHIPVWKH